MPDAAMQAFKPGRVVAARVTGAKVLTITPDAAMQAFKLGRVVAAKVTGGRPMDGLAACTLKASAVEGGTLTFDDVTPGQLISGTVDGVEDFGVFVKLAAGLKYAVQTSSMDLIANCL